MIDLWPNLLSVILKLSRFNLITILNVFVKHTFIG